MAATAAKQLRFKEAALAAQEQALAEEEGETQAMMFALIQDQQKLQFKAMVTANKAMMVAMMEQMNPWWQRQQNKQAEQRKHTTHHQLH